MHLRREPSDLAAHDEVDVEIEPVRLQRRAVPVLLLLSAPLILFTLGFFILVVNALMLLWVGSIVGGFRVDGFWSAFWGGIIISIVSWLLSAFFRGSDGRVHVLTHHTQIKRVEGRVIEPSENELK